eukprot:5134094-Alexandrium_andersonii.AAC.1
MQVTKPELAGDALGLELRRPLARASAKLPSSRSPSPCSRSAGHAPSAAGARRSSGPGSLSG